MYKRYKYKKNKPHYYHVDGIMQADSEIINFDRTGNTKTVFDLKDAAGQIHKCIYWGVFLADEGDRVVVKGRHENNVFLAHAPIIYEHNKKTDCESAAEG